MRRFALLGYPLSHSFSAAWFNEKFRREGIDAEYALVAVPSVDDLEEIVGGLSGFNVTIPHKRAIIPLLDRISASARQVGAVNCVRVERDGTLSGFNTDVEGVRASLAACDIPQGSNALLLGTGGGAAAVEFVLRERGINVLSVSRNSDRAGLTYDTLTADIVEECRLIVNATPVGMFPNVEAMPPLPYQALSDRHFLFDLIYNPAQTRFLQEGAHRGATTINGYDMLICQAEASWRIWNEER